MPEHTAEDPAKMAQGKLADDFNAWWSGVAWTWPPRVAKVKPVVKTISQEKERSHRLEEIKACLKSPQAPGRFTSQSPMSEHLVSQQNSIVPAAEDTDSLPLHHVSPYFEVRKSPKGGYGAFALRDIPSFTDILFEPPLLQATNSDILQKFENLTLEEKDAYLKLASFDELNSNKIIAIFKTNRFELSGAECGIFLISSRFNHSCLPSCTYRYNIKSEKLVVTTKAEDISKGQEITISYGLTGESLAWNYGFMCDCRKCTPDRWVIQW